MKKGNVAAEIFEKLIDYAESNKSDPIRQPPMDDRIIIPDSDGDPETLVLMISDMHAGHKTVSFNFDVLKERVRTLVDRTLRITQIQRKSHPIPNLEIFLLGDLVHGERVGKTVDLDELEDTVSVQVFDHIIPLLEWAIKEFSMHFEKVDVRCVRGNHGVIAKENSNTFNIDDIIYKFLESSFRNFNNVKFTIAKRFFQIVDVVGWKFLLAHGDQIKMYLNIPMYGVVNRSMRWQKTLGEFNVLTIGHFHSFSSFDWNDVSIVINGCFVTDDEWVAKVIGMMGSCNQTLMSVHPKRGITFTSKIDLTKRGEIEDGKKDN